MRLRNGHEFSGCASRRPIIILVNDEYTVERAIHGADQTHTNVAAWNWQLVPRALRNTGDAPCMQARTGVAITPNFAAARPGPGMVLVEAITPKQDVPDLLAAITRSVTGAAIEQVAG